MYLVLVSPPYMAEPDSTAAERCEMERTISFHSGGDVNIMTICFCVVNRQKCLESHEL